MLFSYNFNKTGKILKRLFSVTSAVLRHDGNKEDFVDRSSHRRCSVKKDVLRNFSKFTRKHMSQSLFFLNKVQALYRTIYTCVQKVNKYVRVAINSFGGNGRMLKSHIIIIIII